MDLGAALESRRYSKAMAMDFPDPRAEFPAISEADLKAFEGEMEGKGCVFVREHRFFAVSWRVVVCRLLCANEVCSTPCGFYCFILFCAGQDVFIRGRVRSPRLFWFVFRGTLGSRGESFGERSRGVWTRRTGASMLPEAPERPDAQGRTPK